jgi:signal transduction histidine kinase
LSGVDGPGLRARSWVFDATLAAVLLAANLADLLAGVLQGVYPGSVWEHLPFVVVTALPLVFRRRWPLVALVTFAVLQSVWLLALFPVDQQPPLVPFVQLLVMVYSAGAYTQGRSTMAATVVVALGIAVDIPTLLAGKPVGQVAAPDVALLVAFTFGLLFSRLRRQAAEQEQRAARAERQKQEAIERAAAEERARIARELHDVISHDVSLMVLQASVERHVRGEEDPTAQTLASIESTGREALTELRRMLGVLRKPSTQAPLAPQPGMAQLPQLVQQARSAGLPVRLVVQGDPVPVPAGLDIAVYRIVQEALTNVTKHAAGAEVTTTLRYGQNTLDIEVLNEGTGHGPALMLPAGGHGLVGLRERIALFGGTLEAVPRDTGGFRLRAVLPLAAP